MTIAHFGITADDVEVATMARHLERILLDADLDIAWTSEIVKLIVTAKGMALKLGAERVNVELGYSDREGVVRVVNSEVDR